MRKRILASILSLALMLSFTVPALAATDQDKTVTPVIVLKTTGPIYTGGTFELEATTLKHAPDVHDFWIFETVQHGGSRTFDGTNYINTVTLTAPATAGIYTVRYDIKMSNPGGVEWNGFDTEEINVLIELQLVVENPAAPAVANSILKEAGLSPRYHISGKVYGNLISDVAHKMGPGTDFEGVSKDDVEAYKAAVKMFIDEKIAEHSK
jgi:hypothetical protein